MPSEYKTLNVQQLAALAVEGGYSPAALARSCSISLRQLQRLTRQNFQTSPSRWLRKLKMRTAARLLRRSTNIKQVGYELGFRQVSHFRWEFRTFVGASPSTFIARPKRGP